MKNIILFVILFLLMGCTTHVTTVNSDTMMPPESQGTLMEKQSILSVVHDEVFRRNQVDAKLSVNYLKIYHNWAYVETIGGGDPSVNAVLRKVNGKWRLAKRSSPCMPICPDGTNNCADGEMMCKFTLHKQFLAAPVQIFKSPNARTMVINP